MPVSMEEMLERIDAIGRELEDISNQNRGNTLDPDTKTHWDALRVERDDLSKRVAETRERDEYIRSIKGEPTRGETANDQFVNVATRPARDKAPDNVYALEEYHARSTSQESYQRMLTDGARRAIEEIEFLGPNVDEAKAKETAERTIRRDASGEVAQYVLAYASPTYNRAFGKSIAGIGLNPDEQRTLGIASQGGQLPVPIQIDPTVTLVSNGYINPLRQIARNVQMTGYEWRGVSTTGITAHYGAEGAVAADDSPTLLQPTIDAERAWTFVPYTFEAGQDWVGLEEELGVCIADAKDLLEATMFLTGAGHASSQPKGVLRSTSTVQGTALNTNAGTVFTVQHVYELETALPPRFRPNASWVMNKAVVQRIRQFDTAGGAALWTSLSGGGAPLQAPMPDRLIGYPVYELTTMSTAVPSASGASWALFGDFSKFIIADRIGMSIQTIPQVFSGNTAGGIAYPTGQQGLYAFWRNSSDVMGSNAFRAGTQS
jgi:HK97 family phage major capsid protein